MDSRWHGFVYLRAGVESGAVGASAKVRICEDSCEYWAGGIDFVCLVPVWFGSLFYVGADRRHLRTDAGAGGDDFSLCGVYRCSGAGPECVALRIVSFVGRHWHRGLLGAGRNVRG